MTNDIIIKQKSHADILVETLPAPDNVIQIWFNEKNESNVVIVEKDNIYKLIAALSPIINPTA